MRRMMATIAGFGFAVGVCVFISSFVGTTMEKLWPWSVALHIGIFALVLSIVVFERSALMGNNLFWKEFEQRTPDWVILGIKLLGALFGIIFVLFLILSRAASPEIQNGDFVLNNHGHIVAVLTETEYLVLKGWELRFFASGWMFAYFYLAMYWWFPRNERHSS